MKHDVKRWLLTRNADNSLKIEEKDLNIHIPINRFLDRAGFFSFTFEKVVGKRFLLVFETAEQQTTKTKMLVSKIDSQKEKIVDISNEDYNQVFVLAEKHMGIKTKKVN